MLIGVLKCHGNLNTFLLIDEYETSYDFSEEERKQLSINLCHRKCGLDGDGILFVQKSDKVDGKMRIFNHNGVEAEMCGNGLRCVGRYVMELLGKDEVTIETMLQNYRVKKISGFHEGLEGYQIVINNILTAPSTLPMITEKEEWLFHKIKVLSDDLRFTAVSISNPHIIAIVNKIEEKKLKDLGERANRLFHVFPKGVNVSFVKRLKESNLYVCTYERGVGLTQACGTGMVAASTVMCIDNHKILGRKLKVYSHGGRIQCRIMKEGKQRYQALFIGNATYCYKVLVKVERPSCIINQKNEVKSYRDEMKAYEHFLDEMKGKKNKTRDTLS